MTKKLPLNCLLAAALFFGFGGTSHLSLQAANTLESSSEIVFGEGDYEEIRFTVDGLYYVTVSDTEVAVDSETEEGYNEGNAPSGDIVVPSTVEWNGKTYNVVAVSPSAFSANDNISSVTFNEGIIVISEFAFMGCSNLDTIKLPSSLIAIGPGAFYFCSALNYLTIPEGVTEIPMFCFGACSNLLNISLPNSLKKIDMQAFYACSAMESIVIPEGVEEIGDATFFACVGLSKIQLPASLQTLGVNAFYYCTNISEFSTTEQNTKFSTENGVLFNKDKSLLIAYPPAKDASEYTVPASVKEINSLAFANATNLSKIVIPNGVEKVSAMAFSNCTNLERIHFPASVTSLGRNLFENCGMLAEIHVAWEDPLDIGEEVFEELPIFNMHLYVPEGTESIYMTTEVWKRFGGVFADEIVDGIHTTTLAPATRSVYDLDGRPATLNGKGVRLIRENGKVRKVIL